MDCLYTQIEMMGRNFSDCDDELPDLISLILPRNHMTIPLPSSVRRSPRKHNTFESTITNGFSKHSQWTDKTASSMQRSLSPTKGRSSNRSPLKQIHQPQKAKPQLDKIPTLSQQVMKGGRTKLKNQDGVRLSTSNASRLALVQVDSVLLSMNKLSVQNDTTDTESECPLSRLVETKTSKKRSVMSLMTEAARKPCVSKSMHSVETINIKSGTRPKMAASRFILGEARCNEDLLDSDANDDGEEDEDTDLSGFVVDDDAELSYHESMESEQGSEEDRRGKRKDVAVKPKPRRRLYRGRQEIVENDVEGKPEETNDHILAKAFEKLHVHNSGTQHQDSNDNEVIDLTSPNRTPKDIDINILRKPIPGKPNFDGFKTPRLFPPTKKGQVVEAGTSERRSSLSSQPETDMEDDLLHTTKVKCTTPPATPPRSPTKLKSPTKLFSPSKRTEITQRSPHRASLDSFWDHNVINEFNDQYSPRKAPVISPRKLLDRFHLWSDSEGETNMDEIDSSSGSLPSPCESPSKTRNSPIKSPEKLQRQTARNEKKAELERKRAFDLNKDRLAHELLEALDKNVTKSRMSSMTAGTGGIKIVWSKTLRSTAGRAQWRRSVKKVTESPIKAAGTLGGTTTGTSVEHFAKIELATKIIDRPERLISTLTHEFCHLANYMISGVCDQPHGASFHAWGSKCTKWLREESGRPEWNKAEVATKHNYEIDFKYLWVCAGRDRTMAMDVLNIADDEGCGAEYGRHSKSLDTDKHRCGRCKGKLIQVRPKPRASPKKQMPVRSATIERNTDLKRQVLEKTVEVIELSD